MSVSVTNTTAGISGKGIDTLEGDQTITGNKTFNRSPSAPFTVQAGSASVTNLDADKVDGKHSTDLMLLDGTQSMTGKLNTGSNGQIQFPASQNASADANALDDYEEGTWTPTVTADGGASSQTYTTQLGTYVKVGQLVTVSFYIVLSAKGTLTGNVQIGALPFTSSSAAATMSFNGSVLFANLATSFVGMWLDLRQNSTAAYLRPLTAAATDNINTTVVTANVNNNSTFAGTLTYRASA